VDNLHVQHSLIEPLMWLRVRSAMLALQMNSTSFGHYISFVRTSAGGSGQWYACDDSRVCRTRASDVLSQNAYMLFYQRDSPKPAPEPGYVRPSPLLPLTAVQLAAAAPTTPKAQEPVKANGVAVAAPAAEQVVHLDTVQLDQKQQQEGVHGEGQQQQEQGQQPQLAAMHSQPPPEQPDGGELLPRIATAPAALALLAGRVGSSSRDDDSGSHATTSSCLADVSECSTPSYQANGAADDHGWGANHNRSSSNGSRLGRQSMDESAAATAGDAGAGADDAAKLPQHTLLRRRQRQQQQDPQAAAGAAGEQQGPGAVPQAGNVASGSNGSSEDTSSAGLLPSMQYRVLTAGPELLQVRVQLPGVTSASDVQVAVEPPGQQHAQQCLWLQVPGRFAELQLPLLQHLQSGQAVGAVSGRFYRKKQELKLKLSLASGTGGVSSGSGGSSGGTLDFHLTDSFDTSSGSESEGYQPARRGSMRGVASERDLCSIFGRHSSTVAHQLMQQLQQQRGPGQAEAEAPAAAAAPASKKPANKKKAAGKKKSKRK
jgi:hypothetical protein